MVGPRGYGVTYGFNMLGGTADAMPVLCIESYLGAYGAHASASTSMPILTTLLSASKSTAGHNSAHPAPIPIASVQEPEQAPAALLRPGSTICRSKTASLASGTNNGSTIFAISVLAYGSYGANHYGVFGNMSDFSSENDTFRF